MFDSLLFCSLYAAGVCSGVSFWAVGMPFDSIKARMQTDLNNKYNGFVDCARQTISEKGGVLRLYRGLGVGLFKGGAGAGLMYVTHGTAMKWFNKRDRARYGTP